MPLSELLAAEGLEENIDEVVEWARARADEILATEALDEELGELLGGGNGVAHERRAVPSYLPADGTAPGNTQPGVPLPRPPVERAPLPPVPQRPDLAAKADEPEDLEMLDEDDLELVEDLGGEDEDGAGESQTRGEVPSEGESEGEGEGEPEHRPQIGAGESSPEWKRALIDAQGDDA
ncbi:MAG TPA: hypothetical protein VG755_40285 [Nannocystaceae bacterium]|nr:hypothetical protein [Nannocystaceae bacterium]